MIEGKILDEVRSFLKSRIIISGAELDVFTRLDREKATADTLAEELKSDKKALARLLDSLVAIKLLVKEDGYYQPTERGAFLSSNHPKTELAMVLHLQALWDSWSGLTETVKTGANPRRKPVFERSEESIKGFIGAMHVVGRELSIEIADSYELSGFKRLLDIGGATGTYTIAFLKKNPNMTAVLFDRPLVIPMAKEKLEAEGFLDRVELVAGDFYADELPTGCDLALLSAIIHQNSPEQNFDLYCKVQRALVPDGKVLIRDHVMSPDRTYPPQGALFAINMLVNTEGGGTYTFDEIKEGLEKAGFVDVRMVRKGPKMDCLMEGRKPV